MAKANASANLNKTWSVIVHVSQIVWFPELNMARPTHDYGKTDDLKSSMFERGWIMDGDGTVKIEKINDHYRERAMRERSDQWEELKGLAKLDKSRLLDLEVFKEIYVEGDKLRPIEYIGVTGNRRSSVYFAAMVQRSAKNLPLTTEIPAKIEMFESSLDRLAAQIEENELKTLGFKEMSPVDCLLSAREAVRLGATQSQLRKTFKDGTGQKLWNVVQLDSRFPNLSIIDRMSLDPKDEKFLRLQSYGKEELRNLDHRSDPEKLAEINAKEINAKGVAATLPATEEEVAKYFANPKETEGNKPKIMDRGNIEGLQKNNNNKAVQMTATAILEKNTDLLKPLLIGAPGFNALLELIEYGAYPPAEMILLKILNAGTRREDLVKRLLSAVNE